MLPSVGVQALLTRLADTDVRAQLAYQDRVRAFHARLRNFYYGYLFRDRPFGRADFGRAPSFTTRNKCRGWIRRDRRPVTIPPLHGGDR
ncbi:DUF3526 domain-containing protein [Sphingomonas aerolata]